MFMSDVCQVKTGTSGALRIQPWVGIQIICAAQMYVHALSNQSKACCACDWSNPLFCYVVGLGCCRWDLMKRAPKELVDHILERAEFAAIDDKAVHEQYKQAKKWQRWVLILCRSEQSQWRRQLQWSFASKVNEPLVYWCAMSCMTSWACRGFVQSKRWSWLTRVRNIATWAASCLLQSMGVIWLDNGRCWLVTDTASLNSHHVNANWWNSVPSNRGWWN